MFYEYHKAVEFPLFINGNILLLYGIGHHRKIFSQILYEADLSPTPLSLTGGSG